MQGSVGQGVSWPSEELSLLEASVHFWDQTSDMTRERSQFKGFRMKRFLSLGCFLYLSACVSRIDGPPVTSNEAEGIAPLRRC